MDMELLLTQNTEGERKSKEIQHPWHPDHPLFERFKFFRSGLDQCPICRGLMSGGVFGCEECNFYLHDVCAKRPPELRHPAHPTHPLKLRSLKMEVYGRNIPRCRLCNRTFDAVGLDRHYVVYACDNLNNMCFEVGLFVMHIDCALRKLPSKKHPLHQHPLVLITEDNCLAHCAACGAEVTDKKKRTVDLYRCLDCNVRVHQECFERPITSELQVLLLAQDVQQWKSTEIFHQLAPSTSLSEITVNEADIECALCWSLVNGPAYGCAKREIFLHQHCAKLPEYFLHPMHEFTLCISYKLKRNKCVCNLCHLTHEGDDFRYFYKSTHTNFKMHPYCVALKATWHHPRHEHPFVFVKEGHPSNSSNCPACGIEICSSSVTSASYYLCWTCNISFHERCFDLPTIKPLDRHPHPLTLHFDPVPLNYEDKDYYCDSCEEKRDIHTYSYACQECESEDFNYICHIHCDIFNKPEEVLYEEKLKECEILIAEEEAALEKAQKHTKQLEKKLSISRNKESLCGESLKKLKLHRDEIMKIGR
ncbi:hypothetical protein Ancab_040640 [Ancistrocladus abbreviatus]